jgi:SAM-dependent methyltransferase
MSASLIYRNALLYETAMLLVYGRHYFARYSRLADLIPAGASVLDLCCGPAVLYNRYLRHKSVRYTGVDLNPGFIRRLRERGAEGCVLDLHSDAHLPDADFVVMQASLCHFLPDPKPVVERMLQAARRQVIIAEPVRNLTTSSLPVIAALARRLTTLENGTGQDRFTCETLDHFFTAYGSRVRQSFFIPGGREKVFVLGSAC